MGRSLRLCVEFSGGESVLIPKYYNHAIQGLIYSLMNDDLRSFLHDSGFLHGERRLKLFTFSRLIGRSRARDSFFEFRDSINLWISSPYERLISELANSLIKRGEVVLCEKPLRIKSIEIPEKPVLVGPLIFRTLSPVTIYSTLLKGDGGKKTYYYSPYEPEFSELLANNLKRKVGLIFGRVSGDTFNIHPVGNKRVREVICMFKGTVIKAWEGSFEIDGDPLLLEAMYEAGLGNKNSAGFGMMEVVKEHD